jgi:PBP1b-binding outer membrane lipoprotein LpoB
MKYIYLAIAAVILSGCHEEPKPCKHSKTDIIVTKCPKFETKLKIKIEDLNSTHGAISWGDVSRLESFLKSKKNFNNSVEALNSK